MAQTLVNGILLGGVYLLAAVGLSLVFGVLRIVNLAHGDFVVLGAYLAYVLSGHVGSFFVILAASFLFGLALGVAIFFGVIDKLRGSEEVSWLLVTFGLSAAVVGIIRYVFGPDPHLLNLYSGSYFFGPIYVPRARFHVFVLASVLAGGLWFFLRRSKLGKSIRAVASNPDLATGMGLPTRSLMAVAFVVGTIMAVVAGALLVTVYAVDPEVGAGIVFKSFAILAVGGFRGVLGVGLTSFGLGAGEALVALWTSESVASTLVFAMLLVAVVVRPAEVLAPRGVQW